MTTSETPQAAATASSSGLDADERQLAELLLAARPHGVDALEVACELAAEQGSLSVAVALNALHRLTAPPRPEQLAIDQLALVVEPAANCARYDSLRQVHHG